MFYSRASEALFLFIRLLLNGYVVCGTYPSKKSAEGIIKKCGKIKRFSRQGLLMIILNFLPKVTHDSLITISTGR